MGTALKRPGEKFGGLPRQEAEGFPSEEIHAYLQDRVKSGKWPGVAACAFTGDGSLDKCAFICEHGKANLRKGTAMTADTIVRLYSMTKAFVAVCMLKMVERGLFDLDDEVHTHFKEPLASRFREMRVAKGEDPSKTIPAKGAITIRMLLTHTSGIGSDIAPGLDALTRTRGTWEKMYEGLTSAVDKGQIRNISGFVEALVDLPLWQHPGKEFYYSYGYDVLGYLLECKSGLSLDELMRRDIFEPLGMVDTGFAVQEDRASRLAPLYRMTKARKFGADGVNAELRAVGNRFVGQQHCRVYSGGGCVSSRDGGLTTTLRDYSRFLVTVFNEGVIPGSRRRLFSQAAGAAMLQNHIALVGGHRLNGTPRIFAHNRKGIGLNLLGEVQLDGCEPDPKMQWFDGVPGLIQWGGAASTFYKYQLVNGRPLLLVTFTQVLPQDDGKATSAAFQKMREWAESHPVPRRSIKRKGAA